MAAFLVSGGFIFKKTALTACFYLPALFVL
ncbi:hypothetical protein BSG1_03385 [Bacillus sp. SG-1]|nr:hypothetical protein BSG1_03385 [Bacillus sp. SG-1]